jgi:hypothetical protein
MSRPHWLSRLVRLYPRRWRDRYGPELEALLEDSGAGVRSAADLVRGALDAHLRGLRPRRTLPLALLLLCAAGVGWMNFHATDDVQPVAAALVLAGFGFGAYRPRRAWLFALLLFAAVPASGLWADAASYHPGLVRPAPLYESVIALIPALAGAYLGAGVRWSLR